MEKILGLPVLASEHGKDVDKFIIYIHLLMGVLFIGWLIYFLYTLVRYNRKANPKADYVGIRGHLSSYIEVAVVVAEAVLLLGFAIPLWGRVAEDFPKPSDNPTNMRVVAQQFNWNIFYPGPDGKFGARSLSLVSDENPWGMDKNDPAGKDDFPPLLAEMHVPVNKPVVIMLTSKDVIHSFKIIAMRLTQDAIPGVPIPLHFTPNTVGTYQINCAQLCGNGHSSMAMGRLVVDTQADYEKWLSTKSKAGASFE